MSISNSPSINKTMPKKHLSYLHWGLIFLTIVFLSSAVFYIAQTYPAALSQAFSNSSIYCASLWKDLCKSLNTSSSDQTLNLPRKQIVTYTPLTLNPNNTYDLQTVMHSIDRLNKQAIDAEKDPSIHNRLGILYAQIGDFRAAAKQFNQAVVLCHSQISTSNRTAKKDPSALYVELSCAHSNLARIYDKLGEHDRVIAELEQLNTDIAFAGDNPHYGSINSKKISASQTTIHPSINEKLTPAEAACLARGEALREVGRLAEASQEYVKLIKLNPNLAIAHQRLGLACAAVNDPVLAMHELLKASQLDPRDPDTQNDLGLVYLKMGDYNLAKQSFWQAHILDPKHLNASINLTNLLTATGKSQIAIQIMQRAVIDHPLSAAAHNNLAALLARTGKNIDAAKEFAKAIGLSPTLASAHYGLGLALLNLKSYQAAEREFKIAMSLNPSILDLQNKIEFANRCSIGNLEFPQTIF